GGRPRRGGRLIASSITVAFFGCFQRIFIENRLYEVDSHFVRVDLERTRPSAEPGERPRRPPRRPLPRPARVVEQVARCPVRRRGPDSPSSPSPPLPAGRLGPSPPCAGDASPLRQILRKGPLPEGRARCQVGAFSEAREGLPR